MEDFQEQEYEFLRRLDEERFGRRTLLKRGIATAAGLTIISLPEVALAASMVLGPLLLVALLVIAIGKRHHRRPSSSHWRPTF